MNTYLKRIGFLAVISLILIISLQTAQAAPFAYITHYQDSTVSVIDISTNTLVTTISVGTNPYGVAVSPSGKRVYVVNRNGGSVSVIDTDTNTVIATVTVGSSPFGVAVNATGTRVYVANRDSDNISVIDAATNTVIATVSAGPHPFAVAINPEGTRLYVSNFWSDYVTVIDTNTNTILATVTVGSDPVGIIVNPQGTRVYVANLTTNNLSIIDTGTNSVILTVTVGSSPLGIAVRPGGDRVYVANEGSDDVSVIDTATNTVVTTITVGDGPRGIVTNPAGNRLYVVNNGSDSVSVIDTLTNTVIDTISSVGNDSVAFGQFIVPETIWRGTVSIPLKMTNVSVDGTGNRKFQKTSDTITGRMELFLGGLIPHRIMFFGEGEEFQFHFQAVGSIETQGSKSKTEQLLLIGIGEFFMHQYGGDVSNGVAYLDAKGTVKKDNSGVVAASISLSGKIGASINTESVSSGTLKATLTR